MKVIFVTLFVVAGTLARSGKEVREIGPPCPLDDPLYLPEGPFNASLHPLFEIFKGGHHGETTALGLSSLWYEYTIDLLLLRVNFKVKLGSLDLTSTIDCGGWVDAHPFSQGTVPSGNFTGNGPAHLATSNFQVDGSATLFVNLFTKKVSIRILNIRSFTFDTVSVDLGSHFIIAGNPVDWVNWSDSFKTKFDAEFKSHHATVVERVRGAANLVIGQYTLDELLGLIPGDDGCDDRRLIQVL